MRVLEGEDGIGKTLDSRKYARRRIGWDRDDLSWARLGWSAEWTSARVEIKRASEARPRADEERG